MIIILIIHEFLNVMLCWINLSQPGSIMTAAVQRQCTEKFWSVVLSNSMKSWSVLKIGRKLELCLMDIKKVLHFLFGICNIIINEWSPNSDSLKGFVRSSGRFCMAHERVLNSGVMWSACCKLLIVTVPLFTKLFFDHLAIQSKTNLLGIVQILRNTTRGGKGYFVVFRSIQ